MSFPDWDAVAWGDLPTWGLLIGAAITAYYAKRAFGKQSKELTTLKEQAADGQTLIRQQAELIRVQSDQLAEQRKVTERQIAVLELQAKELEASLEDRRLQRRDQATRVVVSQARGPDPRGSQVQAVTGNPPGEVVTINVTNHSDRAIREVRASWHLGHAIKQQTELASVMDPDAFVHDTQAVPDGANPVAFGAVVYFRDAARQLWRAHPDGALDEIPREQEPRW